MRPTSVTVGSATTSNPLPVNWRATNFNLGLGCTISAGANLVYKIQHTFDDIFDSTVIPVWFDHLVMTGLVANKDGNYDVPVRAVRLNVTSYTSGDVTLTILTQGH